MKSRIENMFTNEVSSLVQKLKKIDHVSTSIKMMSVEKMRFIGMTVHWIEPTTFEQVSRILCIKRFIPPYTIDRVASMVASINQRFEIQDKTVGIVMSNSVNLKSSFKSLGITFEDEYAATGVAIDANDYADELMTNAEDVSSVDGAQCFENLTLIGQYQSACEMLRLVLITDANQALKNAQYANIFRATMPKLNELFRLAKRSAVREAMQSTYQVYIEPPEPTQWQSLYTSIQSIIQYDMVLINKIMVAYNAPEFTINEFEFMNEYLNVVNPVAEALENLQTNGFYAALLPTLRTLRDSLQASQNKFILVFCAPLAEAIHLGFIERFNDFFDVDNEKYVSATIAACTHPFFKLRWIDAETIDQSYFDKITELIVSAALKCISNSTQSQSNQTQTSKSSPRTRWTDWNLIWNEQKFIFLKQKNCFLNENFILFAGSNKKKFNYSFSNSQTSLENEINRTVKVEVLSCMYFQALFVALFL